LELFQQGTQRHMTAEDVYRHLLLQNMDIGIATVYRVLMQFEQADILKRSHFHHHLVNGNSVIFGCYNAQHNLVGYALWFFRKNSKAARLYSMAVLAPYRGRGLSSALIENAAGLYRKWELKRLTLEAREDHDHALDIYRKSGFVFAARRPNYYDDGKAALILQREL
jgi:ribosomal protein S18 acetylase RimI-like enzyme